MPALGAQGALNGDSQAIFPWRKPLLTRLLYVRVLRQGRGGCSCSCRFSLKKQQQKNAVRVQNGEIALIERARMRVAAAF